MDTIRGVHRGAVDVKRSLIWQVLDRDYQLTGLIAGARGDPGRRSADAGHRRVVTAAVVRAAGLQMSRRGRCARTCSHSGNIHTSNKEALSRRTRLVK